MLSGGLIVGQLGDTALQFGRDSTRISVGCETDEFANAHSNLAGRCEFATGLLDFEEADTEGDGYVGFKEFVAWWTN